MKRLMIALLFCAAASAEQPASLRWQEGGAAQWVGGRLYRGLQAYGLTVWVALDQEGSTYQASVTVWNDSGRPLNVIPTLFSVTNPATRKTVWAGTLEEWLATTRPSKFDNIMARARNAAAGAVAAGPQGQRRTGSATIYNPDGTSSRVDIYENSPPPQPQPAETPQQASARRDLADWITRNALRANTIQPGTAIRGWVRFPDRVTKKGEVLVRLQLEDHAFEFPMIPYLPYGR